jgi:hypothetical protein
LKQLVDEFLLSPLLLLQVVRIKKKMMNMGGNRNMVSIGLFMTSLSAWVVSTCASNQQKQQHHQHQQADAANSEQNDSGLSSPVVVIITTVIGVGCIGLLFLVGMRHTEKPEDVSRSLQQEYKRTNFDEEPVSSNNAEKSSASSDKRVLSPAEFKLFHILDIKQVSYNTRLYRIEIPGGRSLSLPVGKCVVTDNYAAGK